MSLKIAKEIEVMYLQGHSLKEIISAIHDLKNIKEIKETWEGFYDNSTSIKKG